ncbi:MAG TPA: TonB-dependent receptor, partial [Gemmatimonadales bacterium]|nr:TonB-dependent receptor [Gemmatimonadales bacterium]
MSRPARLRPFAAWGLGLVAAALRLALATPALAQFEGAVRGYVSRQEDGRPLGGVAVVVQGTSITTRTGPNGSYVLPRVPAGTHVILLQSLGYRAHRSVVSVARGGTAVVDASLVRDPVPLGEVVVTASRHAESLLSSPAAASVANVHQVRAAHWTGQLPNAIAGLPGVDLTRSDVHDFNLNVRGFNSSLTRRVLVLQDGRDLADTFLGAQEWSAAQVLDEGSRMELVRGPGSALYGPNAFSGVLAVTTPTAREAAGARVWVSAGELGTARVGARLAQVLARGRLGYKITLGYGRSDGWSRSRTSLDGLDLRREYAAVTSAFIPVNGVERKPLTGQTVDAASGTPLGRPAPVTGLQGGARLDFYGKDSSLATLEAGAAQVENDVVVTGIGRVQVTKAVRPWARASWDHAGWKLAAWYAARRTPRPQFSLLSGAPLEDHSWTAQAEIGHDRRIAGRARVAMGATARRSHVDTRGTLMPADLDGRTDHAVGGHAQLVYQWSPHLRMIAAARLDHGSLFALQFSPKAALVLQPSATHALRLTVNRAFQTPNYAEFFLSVPAGMPVTAAWTLERALEQYLGDVQATYGGLPAVQSLNLPANLPWRFDSLTPSLALGNANLATERVTEWSLGYRAMVGRAAFVTVDAYANRLGDFVTDLLPAVNPAYPRYLLTDGGTTVPAWLSALDSLFANLGATNQITPAQEATQRGTIAALLGSYTAFAASTGTALATLPDGRRALVV